MGLVASKSGLEKVDRARLRKGWNKDALSWCDCAYVSESTLGRFWRREAIREKNFRNICYALGFTDDMINNQLVDWEKSTTSRESLEDSKTETNLLPFGDKGCITDISRFFNRKALFQQLYQYLKLGWNCSLVGDCQIGKSSILWKLRQEGHQHISLPKRAFIYLDLQLCNTPDVFLQEFNRQLGFRVENHANGFEIRRKLAGKRFIVCLDEMETLTAFPPDDLRSVLSLLRALASGSSQNPITLVTASRSPLSQLFPDSPQQPSPLDNIFHKMSVNPFTEEDARAFIHHRLKETKINIRFSDEQIEQLIQTSQCHPARLQEQAHKLYESLVQE